jgi:hypothetical protein
MGCALKVKAEEVRFAADSPLEGEGFELSVPGREWANPDAPQNARRA